ncbi:MAG: serine/threonine protein kinase [Planctomycetales bacterium]|nr:serine/threonine protein kinase [Planctomycetales bacterium]
MKDLRLATKEEMLLAVEALKMGLMDPVTIQKGLDQQKTLADQGKQVKLFEIFVRQGSLPLDTAKALIKFQKLDGLPDGSGREPVEGYHVTGKLGRGGMAIVYEAEKLAGGGTVALKVLMPVHNGKPVEVARFRREAELLTKFDHANIVKGYDQGESGGLHYLAMEVVRGESVQAILDRDGPLDEDRALYVIVHVAKALDYCQKQGILHRDIKPENILVTPQGRIVLCDLGFAKPLGGEDSTDQDGTTCGTVQYISPEQASGKVDLDIRSDIYSLGATLYHLVVGKVPFSGGESMEVMAKHVLDELENPQALSKNVTSHLSYFIMKMMAKEREIRYQSPAELVEDIETQILGKKTLVFNPDGGPKSEDDLFEAPGAPPQAKPAREAPRERPSRTFDANRLRRRR